MRFAFFFPGQGSQSIGMMAGFASNLIVRETFEQASDALHINLWEMVSVENSLLHETIHTQPLMLTVGVAVWRAFCAKTMQRPHVLAGHSLGEYTALVCASSLDFISALHVVSQRAEFMQSAVQSGTGAMAAILGLDDEAVNQICAQAKEHETLDAANLNAPGQVVIAGHTSAVERGVALAKIRGAKRAIILPVSVPSHCMLMHPASEQLADVLRNTVIHPPQIPIVHNVDVTHHLTTEAIKQALICQLYLPVRWLESVAYIVQNYGITHGAECAPGKVLNGLNKRISPNLSMHALTDDAALSDFITLIDNIDTGE